MYWMVEKFRGRDGKWGRGEKGTEEGNESEREEEQ